MSPLWTWAGRSCNSIIRFHNDAEDSNAIRFSISDVSPDTARILPCVYQDREGISLYDAQWAATHEKVAIPSLVIEDVVAAFLRFKRTCQDFGVEDANIQVLATEATREATNSNLFLKSIKDATGWDVRLLSKEEEGRLCAVGVASSFSAVRGLVMDLGGGSTQITWLIAQDGQIRVSEQGSVSMPYGAAALTRRLAEADKTPGGRELLKREICEKFVDALRALKLPEELSRDGLSLYLSGGGFRGWGFLLMDQHTTSPYPISVINGFSVKASAFHDTVRTQLAAQTTSVFRVSQRRVSQIPAVAFLISVLTDALPAIERVCFCQGGIREGWLFSQLQQETRLTHPLIPATARSAPPSSRALIDLLQSAIPDNPAPGTIPQNPTFLTRPLLAALINFGSTFAPLPKDIRASSALRSTTSGQLGGTHGLTHEERALLALLLCERWNGLHDLPPTDAGFYASLRALVGPLKAWWAMYVGRLASLIGEVYQAGVLRDGETLLRVRAEWNFPQERILQDGRTGVELRLLVVVPTEEMARFVAAAVKDIEKAGKTKNWIDGVGFRIEVPVEIPELAS